MIKPNTVLPYPEPINEIVDFAVKVFNYYNGRINIINNPAVLIINNDASELYRAYGCSQLPNYVIFYSNTYLDMYSDHEHPEDWKGLVVETIIHELHHVDQCVTYYRHLYGDNANMAIEDSVELQTSIYILMHTHEMAMFGVPQRYIQHVKDVYDEFIYACLEDNYYPYYKRIDYISHLYDVLLLYNLYGFDWLNKVIKYVFNIDPELSTFKLIINDVIYTIKEQGFLMHISEFNAIIANTHIGVPMGAHRRYKISYKVNTKQHVYIYKIDIEYNEGLTIGINPEEE